MATLNPPVSPPEEPGWHPEPDHDAADTAALYPIAAQPPPSQRSDRRRVQVPPRRTPSTRAPIRNCFALMNGWYLANCVLREWLVFIRKSHRSYCALFFQFSSSFLPTGFLSTVWPIQGRVSPWCAAGWCAGFGGLRVSCPA